MSIVETCDRQSAFPGDTVTYQYQVSNKGDVPLSSITVADDRAGSPGYLSGDTNADGILDENEIWVFTAAYTVKDKEIGNLTNHATASGKGPGNQPVAASGSVTINVTDIVVAITSLQNDAIVSSDITVAGTVNDPSITQAVLTFDSSPMTLSVVNGTFSTTLHLTAGSHSMTVTVTKAGGITRSSSPITLEPEPAA
jgi:hypothetical protein